MTSSSLLDMVGPKSLKPISLIVGLPTHFKPDPNSNMVSERVWPGFSNSRLSVWMSSPSGPISQISGCPSGCPVPAARFLKFPVLPLPFNSKITGFKCQLSNPSCT